MELHLKINNNNNNASKDENAAVLSSFISPEYSPKGSSQTADSDGIRDDTPKISNSSDTTTFSSSSNSYSDDSSQVNNMFLRSSAPHNIPKPIRDAKPFYGNDRVDDFPSKALFRSEEGDSESPTSQLSGITHESLAQNTPPTQSPTAQVMKRSSGVYDPGRISASIFSGPSTPTDWSTASNESLFSIHVGNISFFKDDVRMSANLQRPEELHKSKELYHTGNLQQSTSYQLEEFYKSSELIELDEHGRTKKIVPAKKGTEKSSVGTKKARANDKPYTNFQGPRDFSVVHQLDNSQPVIQSSPFSKKKKSSCLHCHCSDCYETLFCCKLSSCFICSGCSCKWLNCSSCHGCCCSCHSPNCTWACCSCWMSKPKKPCYGSTFRDIS